MDPAERHELAAQKTEALIDHSMTLIQTHANNQIVMFSTLLSDQIPESYAAHAFNNFQASMFAAELTRLCSFWDDVDLAKESIPTVIALLDDAATLRHIFRTQLRECYAERDNLRTTNINRLDSTTLQIVYDGHLRRSCRRLRWEFERSKKIIRRLGQGAAVSQRLAGLAGFRDRYIAHNIDQDLARPMSRGRIYQSPKYVQARRLLNTTCKVLNAFNGLTRRASFDFAGSFDISHRNAEQLWRACRFEGIK